MQGSGGFLGVATTLLGVAMLAAVPVAHAQRGGESIRCESTSGHYQRCPVPWRDAQMVRQESKASCVQGQSWGMDRQGLWVDRGCRAVFAQAYRGRPDDQGYGRDDGDRGDHRGDMRQGNDWNRQIRLSCDSNKSSYQLCQVDVGRNGAVRLVQQTSNARCTEGYSWGSNRAGVWVNHGCRGQFVVDRRR